MSNVNQSQRDSRAVLVVDDEPEMLEMFRDVIAPGLNCRLHVAADLAEARRVIRDNRIELMVADVGLPDGNGMDLLEDLRLKSPTAAAVLMTGRPGVEGAVYALRHGVLDYLPKPFNLTQAGEQLSAALARQQTEARNEKRLKRLKTAVKAMNQARKMVTKKVDLLCNDLVGAYGDLTGQMATLRTQESFRRTIEQAGDLEQLLCHSMDWLLKEAGYSNIAIWLSGDEDRFELGAYMKYTIVGDAHVTDAMKNAVVSGTVRDGFLNLSAEDLAKRLTPSEKKLLANQACLSTSCTYLGESLAVISLFRDAKTPYRREDDAMLRQIATVFATRLTTLVKRADDGEESDWSDDKPKEDKKKKPDPADWWKTGGDAPF